MGTSPENVIRKLPRGAQLLTEVELAKKDPHAYVKRFAKRLDNRGIDEPVPELDRIALVDGLLSRRMAVEIDVREDPEGFLAELRRIVPSGQRKQLPKPEELEALAPAENDALLQVVGDRLETAGLCLVELDIGADCYPLAVVAESVVDEFIAFSKTTRGRVRRLRGANLNKLQQAAALVQKRDAARAEKSARRAAAQGPAWAKLTQERYSSFSLAVSCLSFMDAAEQKLFVAAAKEAPEQHKKRAQLIADLLKDPVPPARKADPLEVVKLLPELPWDPKRIAKELKALTLLENRLQLARSEQHRKAFWKACGAFARERERARRALPKATLERWRQSAEQQFFEKPSLVLEGALEWLGDERTLEKALATTKPPRSRDAVPSPKQHLVYDLAAATKRKLKGWPKPNW